MGQDLSGQSGLVLGERLLSPLLGASLALVLVTSKGFGAILALVFLVSLFSLRPQRFATLRRQDRIFLLLINTYPLLVAISMLLHGFMDAALFDNASRFLLFSVVYIALRSRPFNLSHIVIGAMAGCALTFASGLLYLLNSSALRFSGFEGPIVVAQISFFLLLLATTPVAPFDRPRLAMGAWLAALVVMVSTVVVLSQSRIVLSALLALSGYLLFFDPRRPRSRVLRGALLLSVIVAVLYALTTPQFHHLEGTAAELMANFGQIDQFTSLGARIALWFSSGHLIIDAPVFGHGIGQFNESLNALPEAASFRRKILSFAHAHSDFLQIAVEQGLWALAAFVGSLVALLIMGWREHLTIGARHLLLGTMFFWVAFGLTETQLAHQKTTMMFALLLVLAFSHGMNWKYGALVDDT